MKQENPFQKVTENRTQVMGVSMLMIIIFHLSVNFNGIPFWEVVKEYGDIGVDIFLLLSGIGIYYSLSKNFNYKIFFWKRVKRVLVTYETAAIPWCLLSFTILNQGGWVRYFADLIMLRFWIFGHLSYWFVPCILALYLMSPVLFNLINRAHKKRNLALMLIFYGVAALLTVFFCKHLTIAVSRVVIYVIGMLVGKSLCEQRTLNVHMWILGGLALVALILVGMDTLEIFPLNPMIRYWLYIPIALFLVLFVVRWPGFLSLKLFTILGIYSLEIYLVHEKTIYSLDQICQHFFSSIENMNIYLWILNILALMLTIPLAYLLKNATNWVNRMLFSEKVYVRVMSPYN